LIATIETEEIMTEKKQTEPKVGDVITFEMSSTEKWHTHQIIRIEQGCYIVECEEKEITVMPNEIKAVFAH